MITFDALDSASRETLVEEVDGEEHSEGAAAVAGPVVVVVVVVTVELQLVVFVVRHTHRCLIREIVQEKDAVTCHGPCSVWEVLLVFQPETFSGQYSVVLDSPPSFCTSCSAGQRVSHRLISTARLMMVAMDQSFLKAFVCLIYRHSRRSLEVLAIHRIVEESPAGHD